MSVQLESKQNERREFTDRRQPTSASRVPWKANMNGTLAVIIDRFSMPVANIHVFDGSAAHGRLDANVDFILRACNAHHDLVSITKMMLDQLKAAADSDARSGLNQSENIRRYQLARNGLIAAGVKA